MPHRTHLAGLFLVLFSRFLPTLISTDIEHDTDFSTWPPTRSRVECATPERVQKLYEQQRQVPGYANLLNANVTIFGTIDDHDFGCDNGDKRFAHKNDTTNAFVEFIGEPQDSPMARRAAAGKGVYGVKVFDFGKPAGDHLVPDSEACVDPDYLASIPSCRPTYSNKTVAVFVLDVRTNKDPWREGKDAYFTDHEGDYLGEEQWKWFEAAIAQSNAAVNVVVNGLQVHSKIFPNPNIAESWGSFPYSQQRLLNAVLAPSVQAPFLISGDVHMSQLHRKDCRHRSSVDAIGGETDHQQQALQSHRHRRRPLMELTTSGMTHSWGQVSTPYRIQDGTIERQASRMSHLNSFVASVSMHTLHQIAPWRSLVKSRKSGDDSTTGIHGGLEGSKQGLQYSLERNFGELEFNWDDRTVTIRSLGEDPTAPPLIAARVSMDQLSGMTPMESSTAADGGKPLTDTDFAHLAAQNTGEWLCIEHRGSVSFVDELLGHANVVLALAGIFVVFPVVIPLYILSRISRRKKRRHTVVSLSPSSPDSVSSSDDTIPSMASSVTSDSSVASMDELMEYISIS